MLQAVERALVLLLLLVQCQTQGPSVQQPQEEGEHVLQQQGSGLQMARMAEVCCSGHAGWLLQTCVAVLLALCLHQTASSWTQQHRSRALPAWEARLAAAVAAVLVWQEQKAVKWLQAGVHWLS